MKTITGTSNRVLQIDLSSREVKELGITERDRRMYLGGKGIGLKLLYERLQPGTDPLGKENILIFMMGVLMGTGAPCSGRFAAVTKSPLTKGIVSSSCGGPFGMAYKTAGYDGLIVTGKSDKPTCLVINSEEVKFRDAKSLWGKDAHETQEAFNLDKKDGALVIGPAGENRVLYANIVSGHRYIGRCGFGAVMGAKNLKAIVAYGGEYKIVPKDINTFNRARKTALKYINSNPFLTEQYRKYGTASHFKYCNKTGTLSVMNFKQSSHERAHEVSGEAMSEKYKTKHSGCIACAIQCGHKGTDKNGVVHQMPEFQSSALLGPNLGIFDTDLIIKWNDLCGRMGMDTISAGTTLAYVMEAGEKGLIKTGLTFGSSDGVYETLENIAHRRGKGDELANGTAWLSEKYGGKEFALHVKGMEMTSYDPRGAVGQALSFATNNRGGHHLSAFLVGQEILLGLLNPDTTRTKVLYVLFFEALFSVANSIHTCLFTAYAYILEKPLIKITPDKVVGFVMQNMRWLAIKLMGVGLYNKFFESITGIKMSQKELMKAGHRIYVLERYMNTREGVSRKDDTLPERFLKESRASDPKKRVVPLEKMLNDYYKARGYDEDGIPTAETLKKYGIERR